MKSPFDKPFKGVSPFGPGAGNGLTINGQPLVFLASALPYTVTGGNTISVADSRAAGGTYGVSISISSGTLTLSGITGLSFSVGDGTADASMSFTGSLANINSALASSVIASASAGAQTISITFSHAATLRTKATVISVTVGVVVANSVLPAISGTLDYGNVLTCSTGTWTGTPAPTYTYQWQNAGSNISGQTANTYTSVFGDVGDTITCEVTATNAFNSVMAEATGVVILDPEATPAVLSGFVDDLEVDPPALLFDSDQAGTVYFDYHTSATPPTLGAGDVDTYTDTAVSGANNFELDLSAYAGQTFYVHIRLSNGNGTSNTLTSQEITVPAAYSDSTWTAWTEATVTANNVTDPYGGSLGDSLRETAVTEQNRGATTPTLTFNATNDYLQTWIVKPVNWDWVAIFYPEKVVDSYVSQYVRLSTASVTTTVANTTVNVSTMPNGYVKIEITSKHPSWGTGSVFRISEAGGDGVGASYDAGNTSNGLNLYHFSHVAV
jgi:hypothetical protein